MRLRFRLLKIILAALLRDRDLNLIEESRVALTVLPWDCVVKYVGNDRYHAFLDLARVDLALRLGWLQVMLRRRWQPQVVSCHIRHRYPLYILDRFVIRSYITQSNLKYIWMAHKFERDGIVVSTAVSKMVAVSRTGITSLFELPQLLTGDHSRIFTQEKMIHFTQVETVLRNL